MLEYGLAYVATAVAFFALDFMWLSLASGPIYRSQLGDLLLDSPSLPVAGMFYLLYVVGIVVFAVMPAIRSGSWPSALGLGALLGLVAYGTYDFTNLSTIKGWSGLVSVVDLVWGTALTAVAACAGYAAVRAFSPS